MLKTRVEVGEALHLHGQMLLDFIQRQKTSLRHNTPCEVSANLRSNSASNRLVESGECVQSRLFVAPLT